MMKVNIDLGYTYDSGPQVVSPSTAPDKHYPEFTYSGDEEMEIPREGTMLVRYKRVRSSESEDEDGDEKYTCSIQVQEIISVEGDKTSPTKSGSEAEDALDALMKKKMQEKD